VLIAEHHAVGKFDHFVAQHVTPSLLETVI
jgi:hypothetical protein